MYELLMGWALNSLSQFTTVKDSKDLAIVLEAIKAKNELVKERFGYAYASAQQVVELSIKVESELIDFRKNVMTQTTNKSDGKRYIALIKQDFHPKYYRQLTKIRSGFESTNDLLAAYSEIMSDIVRINMLEQIVETKMYNSPSDINRSYRGLWTLYSNIVTSLVRLTANDLRFWLTDNPYVVQAEQWAQDKDLDLARQFLLSRDWGGRRFHLTLESKEGLEQFWKAVSSR